MKNLFLSTCAAVFVICALVSILIVPTLIAGTAVWVLWNFAFHFTHISFWRIALFTWAALVVVHLTRRALK